MANSANGEVFRNARWHTTEKAVSVSARALMAVLVIRTLGPSDYGLYSYAISMVTIGAVMAGAGIDQLLVREIGENPGRSIQIVRGAIRLRILMVGVVALSIAALALMFDSGVQLGALLVTLPVLLLPVGEVFEATFHARSEFRSTSLIRLASTLINAAAFLILSVVGGGVVPFLATYATSQVGLAIALSFSYKASPGSGSAWPEVRRIWKEGWPLAITTASIIILFRIDIVMLSFMAGAEATGIYGAGARLSELGHFVPVAVAAAFFPQLVAQGTVGSPEYIEIVGRLIRSVVALGSAIMVVGIVSAPLVIRLAFGSEYAQSADVLRIHLLSFPFVSLAFGHGRHLLAARLIRPAAVLMFSGAVLNIALNGWMIPRYGPLGAAWATVISYAWIGYFGLWARRATRPVALLVNQVLFDGSYFKFGWKPR